MRWNTLVGVVACVFALQNAAAAGDESYRLLKQVPIGGEGGWDILTVDSEAQRLYLSHSTRIDVVDLAKDAVVGEISDTPGVHGFVAVPELGRGFSTNGKEAKASVVDLKTLKTISKVDTGENPDALVYEPRHKEIYVFNHTGNSATVIDATMAKVIMYHSAWRQSGIRGGRQRRGACLLQYRRQERGVAIDTTKHEIVAHWPVAPGEEPSGIAFDPVHHRLFVGCHNKMMAMLDTGSGKVVTTVPIGARVDGCAFDETTQLAFASCGDGTTTIAKEAAPGKLSVVQTLKTERGARTIALDPRTHRIYLPTAQFGPEPTPGPGAPRWPAIIPNSMKLLVFGPGE